MATKQKFGVGVLIATARFDAQGNALAVPFNARLGILQDVSTDFSFESKTLYGANQLPVDKGRGKAKLAFSAKTADINATALAALHFGTATSVGFKGPNLDVAGTIPAVSTFIITAAPPASGTFVADLGVKDTSGNDFKRVASAPTTGQYSVNETTGVYTFASADANKAVLYSYEYSSATGGLIVPMTNQLMGYSPSFSVILLNDSKGSKLVVKLTNCQSDKLSLPFKNEDFVVADFGWEALDDGTGSAGYWCQT